MTPWQVWQVLCEFNFQVGSSLWRRPGFFTCSRRMTFSLFSSWALYEDINLEKQIKRYLSKKCPSDGCVCGITLLRHLFLARRLLGGLGGFWEIWEASGRPGRFLGGLGDFWGGLGDFWGSGMQKLNEEATTSTIWAVRANLPPPRRREIHQSHSVSHQCQVII